jgi:hypothetical protein
MIKSVMGGGRYLTVSTSGGSTYVNNYNGAQGVGNVRYNTSNQNMEVYDGSTWITLQPGFSTVSMTPEAESLLDWAREKKIEEEHTKSLAQSNPTIADLVEQKKKIDEQISIVKTLIKSEVSN